MAFSWFWSHVDGYVVHIYGDASFVNEVTEYGIHHGLKSGGGVGQAKEHDCRFVEPFVSDEGCFPSVFWFYQHFVVPPFNVKSSKKGAVS